MQVRELVIQLHMYLIDMSTQLFFKEYLCKDQVQGRIWTVTPRVLQDMRKSDRHEYIFSLLGLTSWQIVVNWEVLSQISRDSSHLHCNGIFWA